MILLDTHVLLWLDSADPRLGAKAKEAIDEAHRADWEGVVQRQDARR